MHFFQPSQAGSVLLAASTLLLPTLAQKCANTTPRNLPTPHLALDRDFPDPSLLQDPDTCAWYSFSTGAGGGFVEMARREANSSTWTFLSSDYNPIPQPGGWLQSFGLWAPDVHRLPDERYIMWFTGSSKENSTGKGSHCVSYAFSDKIGGLYSGPDEPWNCESEKGGSIDPAGFFDEQTGTRWVVYKIDGNAVGPKNGPCGNERPSSAKRGNWAGASFSLLSGRQAQEPVDTPIMLQQVSVADGFTKIGEPSAILHREEEDGPLIEAPQIVFEGGKYVMFYSSHCFSTTLYDVRYATADSVTGPWTKAKEPLIKTGDFEGVFGPGGMSASGDGYMVFHGLKNGKTPRRFYEVNYKVNNGVVEIGN